MSNELHYVVRVMDFCMFIFILGMLYSIMARSIYYVFTIVDAM